MVVKILGVFALLLSLFYIWHRSVARRDGPLSLTWPRTPGRITKSNIVEAISHTGKPASESIRYAYDVSDKSYSGQDVTLIDGAYDLHTAAQRYQVGQTVEVYYDPENPFRAVLIPGTDNQIFGRGPIGELLFLLSQLAVLGMGGGFCYLALTTAL